MQTRGPNHNGGGVDLFTWDDRSGERHHCAIRPPPTAQIVVVRVIDGQTLYIERESAETTAADAARGAEEAVEAYCLHLSRSERFWQRARAGDLTLKERMVYLALIAAGAVAALFLLRPD